MEKPKKNKEEIFWMIFIVAVVAIAEIANHISLGTFEICGRYSGCGQTDLKGFILFIEVFVGAILFFNLISNQSKMRKFINHQPSYVLVIFAILFLAIAFFSPRYIGIIPGLLSCVASYFVLQREIKKSIESRK